jgi:hypothetical protein
MLTDKDLRTAPVSEAQIVRAPWTPEQVDALNRWQQDKQVHPFTCGGDECRATLYATPDGWRCPMCGYTQTWAHQFMACPPTPAIARTEPAVTSGATPPVGPAPEGSLHFQVTQRESAEEDRRDDAEATWVASALREDWTLGRSEREQMATAVERLAARARIAKLAAGERDWTGAAADYVAACSERDNAVIEVGELRGRLEELEKWRDKVRDAAAFHHADLLPLRDRLGLPELAKVNRALHWLDEFRERAARAGGADA